MNCMSAAVRVDVYKTQGILRITGQGADWRQYHVKVYTSENGRICNNFINCIFRDSLGRIWAGTEGGGLALFNRTEDRFRPVHLAWNLPGDVYKRQVNGSLQELFVKTGIIQLLGFEYKLFGKVVAMALTQT